LQFNSEKFQKIMKNLNIEKQYLKLKLVKSDYQKGQIK